MESPLPHQRLTAICKPPVRGQLVKVLVKCEGQLMTGRRHLSPTSVLIGVWEGPPAKPELAAMVT